MPLRPPIKEAHQAATRTVVARYQDEWQAEVDSYLAGKGWLQQEVTTKKWMNLDNAPKEK